MDFKQKISIFLIMVMSTIFLSGCWDAVEIDQRGMVFSVGIDRPNTSTGKEKKYRTSYEVPTMQAVSGTAEEKPWILTTTGDTIFEAIREANIRSDRPLFFAQDKVLVIGEEAARGDVYRMLDFFTRDPELTRNMNIFIAKGEALDVLSVKPHFTPIIGVYLRQLSQAKHKSSRFRQTELSDLIMNIKANGSALAARVVASPTGDEVKIGGASVFKGPHFVGWLGELENRGALFIEDEVEGGEIVVPCPICGGKGHPEETISYEIMNASSKMKADVSGEKIHFRVDIYTEGSIQEHSGAQYHSLMELAYIKQIEKAVGEEISREAKAASDKLQYQFGADALGYGNYLQKNHPDLWKKIQKRWQDEIFPEIEVEIHTQVKIRRVGTAT